MKILFLHITTEKTLKKKIEAAKTETRKMSNRQMQNLLTENAALRAANNILLKKVKRK